MRETSDDAGFLVVVSVGRTAHTALCAHGRHTTTYKMSLSVINVNF